MGIELPTELRSTVGLHVEEMKDRLPEARWVQWTLYHFTLVFLGDCESSLIPKLEATLVPSFSTALPFEVQLCGAGTFPPRQPGRVVWLGVEKPSAMREVQSNVVDGLRAVISLRVEKRLYHPHLTVARCKRPWPRRATEIWSASVSGRLGRSFKVDHATLFRSQLSPQGARYEPIRAFAMRGGAAS